MGQYSLSYWDQLLRRVKTGGGQTIVPQKDRRREKTKTCTFWRQEKCFHLQLTFWIG